MFRICDENSVRLASPIDVEKLIKFYGSHICFWFIACQVGVLKVPLFAASTNDYDVLHELRGNRSIGCY